jgi:hypothetical protein
MRPYPKIIQGKNPSDLYGETMKIIETHGGDLLQPLFVSLENKLCQWVALGRPSFYEYELIAAPNPEILDSLAARLSKENWETLYHTVQFQGNYLQWFFRMKSLVAHVPNSAVVDLPAPLALNMVQNVQPLMILESVSSLSVLPRKFE